MFALSQSCRTHCSCLSLEQLCQIVACMSASATAPPCGKMECFISRPLTRVMVTGRQHPLKLQPTFSWPNTEHCAIYLERFNHSFIQQIFADHLLYVKYYCKCCIYSSEKITGKVLTHKELILQWRTINKSVCNITPSSIEYSEEKLSKVGEQMVTGSFILCILDKEGLSG